MARALLFVLTLTAVVLLVYAPVRDHRFVVFDDPLYVEAPEVKAGLTAEGFVWAFETGRARIWHPLTWLSLQAGATLHGVEAAGPFALGNVALHAACAALLFGLLLSLTGRPLPCALVAALFALHPLRVESVAWVAGRKDPLSVLFALGALWAWVGFARRGGAGRYAGALVLYGLSLLAKPAHFALPFLMLLLDFWPLARLGRAALPRRLLEKLPFLLLAAAAAAVSVAMIDAAPSPWGHDAPLSERLLTMPVDIRFHLEKTLWPAGLTIVHPRPYHSGDGSYGAGTLLLAWTLVIAISGLALASARRWPYVTVGWLWFLLALAPTLQLIPSGLRVPHDRYTYLPSVGLFLALAFLAADASARWPRLRPAAAAAAVAVLAILSVLSARQVAHWRDDESLYAHALAVYPRNVIVLHARGVSRARAGQTELALDDFAAAIALHPEHADSQNNMGYLLAAGGDPAAGIPHLRRALAARPGYVTALTNLGRALDATGAHDEALVRFREAVTAAPDSPDVRYWLALALERRGARDEALAEYRRALELRPGLPWATAGIERLRSPRAP